MLAVPYGSCAERRLLDVRILRNQIKRDREVFELFGRALSALRIRSQVNVEVSVTTVIQLSSVSAAFIENNEWILTGNSYPIKTRQIFPVKTATSHSMVDKC